MPRSVFVMPETIHAPPVPVQGKATVPLASFVRPFQRHYFSRLPERPNYRARSYDFAGLPALMPLVRAFLDTCAATETADYRYLFTLLGSELANNAIGHSLSGHPGGAYTLRVHRNKEGLHLTCQDRGGLYTGNTHLTPTSGGLGPGVGWPWWMPWPPSGATTATPCTALCGCFWPTTWPRTPGTPLPPSTELRALPCR